MVSDNQQQVYSKILRYLQSRQYLQAEQSCLFELGQRAAPDARLLFYLGTAAGHLHKHKAAIVAFEAALRLQPDNLQYLQGCAAAYEAERKYEQAYQLINRALQIAPQNIAVMANHAVALERVNNPEAALKQYQEVLGRDEQNVTANLNLGALLRRMGRTADALAQNRLAHARLPEMPATLYNLVDTLIANFQYEEALAYCDAGLAHQPRHAYLIVKKAMALSALCKPVDALSYLSQARIIDPYVLNDMLPYARALPAGVSIYLDGYILQYEARDNEQRACFWRYRDRYLEQLRRDAELNTATGYAQRGKENGFRVLLLDIDAQQRKQIMRRVADGVADFAWLLAMPPLHYRKPVGDKIRIGYLSPDFRMHATAVLSRQLYGLHDRDQFSVYAYSLHNSVEQKDIYRADIEAACDYFHDISAMNSADAARKINADGIGILVDLAGYTTHARPEIMALRPAPVQIQYLGFSGTMGADFIDYALVDKVFCPDSCLQDWHEKQIRLPHSHYLYDNCLNQSATSYTRSDFGLPDGEFVFCALNNSNKIEPVIFGCWMKILAAVPNSVLWLLGKHSLVEDNLKREAAVRGVGAERLIFTERLPLERHLPRYQLADLFLDTYWANAHTTCAEAVWQGLPLLTCIGEVPSARGAASILTALEMPELIMQDFDEYEQRAIFYATHPVEYLAMREKLRAKRYTAPMYNTKLTVKHIERAYQMAWARYRAGLPPAALDVPEITDPTLRESIR